MPEGPSIVILKEEVSGFRRKKVLAAPGNSKIDRKRLVGKTVKDFKSWGKHFLICFDKFYLRIHFLLFGSYRINENKNAVPRLTLEFSNGEINFYACSIKLIEGAPEESYDFDADVMSDTWSESKARKKMKALKMTLACDVLLDQEIFAGVGNIIKNEVLYRIRVHPESEINALPPGKLTELIRQSRIYSFDFYEWKKQFVLKKNWLCYKKQICRRCNLKFSKGYIGKTARLTYWCNNCQVMYQDAKTRVIRGITQKTNRTMKKSVKSKTPVKRNKEKIKG